MYKQLFKISFLLSRKPLYLLILVSWYIESLVFMYKNHLLKIFTFDIDIMNCSYAYKIWYSEIQCFHNHQFDNLRYYSNIDKIIYSIL